MIQLKSTNHLICALSGLILVATACSSTGPSAGPQFNSVKLEEIVRKEVAAINRDVIPGPLTMDVGIVLPSNLDPAFQNVSVDQLLDGVRFAKNVFARADVQIQLLWVKTGPVDPSSLSIMESLDPGQPTSRHVGMYSQLSRHPTTLSEHARSVFESVIPPHQDNSRTLYLIVLQDVFMPYYAKNDAGDYIFAVTPTSGLSFPGYMFGAKIPRRLRGAITLTNLTHGKNPQKTIAHEIGHKAINVSHEYMDASPGFEIVGEGGLMIYGSGTEIPSGAEGRWHRERLHLSPFLYRVDHQGHKQWNPDYLEHGHYFDPIYGEKCVSDIEEPEARRTVPPPPK